MCRVRNALNSVSSVFVKEEKGGTAAPIERAEIPAASAAITDKKDNKKTKPKASPPPPKLVEDYRVTEKWHRGWARPLDSVKEIVVHGTGGGSSAENLIKWMLSGERKKEYQRGVALFHFAVDFDGTIYQLAPLSRWFYHSSAGQYDKYTIGIENLNGSSSNSNAYKDAQYKSLFWLCFEYIPGQCKNIERIVSHDYNKNRFTGSRKGCPGTGFDWSRIEKEMKTRQIGFENLGFEAYVLKKA